MESDSESSISYSQQEVIWAKIQGHPWWPAFIDQVHRDNGGKTQYTVNFFGDYTQLGASKLNKFQEFYAEHYPKARTHRKLMASLKLAQQTMKENEQDIQVFADIRQDLMQKRRWQTKVTQIRRDSSSSNESDQIQKLPKFQKATTSVRSRTSRSKPLVEKIEYENSEFKQQRLKRNRSLPASNQAHWMLKYPRKFAEDTSQVQSFYNNQSIVNQEHNKIYGELQQQSLSDGFQRNQNKKDKTIKKARQIPVSNGKPGKRGRPRKIIPSEVLNDSKENHFSFCPRSKRKIIHKTTATSKLSFKSSKKGLSKQNVQIIQNTRKLMKNREALVDYLTDVTITTTNVQQILELGVVQRLREEGDQKQVQDIISMLMNTLILKYFPNDNTKKDPSFNILQRKKKNAANSQRLFEGLKEKQEYEVKEKNCLSGEECRKKTVLKLQKYLSKNSEPLKDSSIRDLSIQIEAILFSQDSFVEQRYKRLALKVLSALKEGSITPFELIRKLKEHKYD